MATPTLSPGMKTAHAPSSDTGNGTFIGAGLPSGGRLLLSGIGPVPLDV